MNWTNISQLKLYYAKPMSNYLPYLLTTIGQFSYMSKSSPGKLQMSYKVLQTEYEQLNIHNSELLFFKLQFRVIAYVGAKPIYA